MCEVTFGANVRKCQVIIRQVLMEHRRVFSGGANLRCTTADVLNIDYMFCFFFSSCSGLYVSLMSVRANIKSSRIHPEGVGVETPTLCHYFQAAFVNTQHQHLLSRKTEAVLNSPSTSCVLPCFQLTAR